MDSVFKNEFHGHAPTGEIARALTQPTEDLILERNSELRKNPDAIKDLGQGSEGGTWGRMVATIPMIVFEKAIRDGYQLNSKDSDIASKEMHRFLLSEQGKLCLVR